MNPCPASTPLAASKKEDKKRRNTSSSSRWRLKSGYLFHLFNPFDLESHPVLENGALQNARGGRLLLLHALSNLLSHFFTPLILSVPTRPSTNRGNVHQIKQNDAVASS
jgi:hypothetical protein